MNKLVGGWGKGGEDKKQFGSYGCSGYQQRVHHGGVATNYTWCYRQHHMTSPSLSSSGNLLTCKVAADSRETPPLSVLTVVWRN